MPREVTLLCRRPVEIRDVAEALLLHDETWGVRALDDGPVMQVCRDATHPVVTVLGVRRVDAFDEVERILRMDETGAVGGCASCGAPHSSGATYCWQCGQPLLQQVSGESILRR